MVWFRLFPLLERAVLGSQKMKKLEVLFQVCLGRTIACRKFWRFSAWLLASTFLLWDYVQSVLCEILTTGIRRQRKFLSSRSCVCSLIQPIIARFSELILLLFIYVKLVSVDFDTIEDAIRFDSFLDIEPVVHKTLYLKMLSVPVSI